MQTDFRREPLKATRSGPLVELPFHPHLAPMSVPGSTSSATALARLARIGRTPLATVPTPLHPAPALAAHLGTGVQISIKADDCTGLGLGGNKVRKLEYELDPARLHGVTHLVTAGGPHSNHCRVTAAAAARLGLGCTLVVNGEPEDPGRGNALLHRLLGARIVTVRDREDRDRAMEEEVRRIGAAGGKALAVPIGASTARGAFGYVHAVAEVRDQAGSDGEAPWIFTSSSSGGTLAGLILGCAIFDWRARLVAVSADEPAAWIRGTALRLAMAAAHRLEPDPGAPSGNPHGHGTSGPGAGLANRVRQVAEDAIVTDDLVGAGYGIATREGQEATRLFGTHTGVILDPVYTAKAAAAMIAWLREGRVPAGDNAVFLHTGGHPALFR
ncbi:MAG: pyridoxal-phosphate dependent enzyme [Gemmatimonadetes bacterium]|nr:pyridoxal-phosphate dependent enzyme [Gemmatimonadota bacterium]MYB97478.1 pyridoxal-phosphate dependent enzyme [Gemmatimonadota bacterium]MYI45611.1 pyridoxal-phosphate dependent enzyme [Gemmatimonadota bacterium]